MNAIIEKKTKPNGTGSLRKVVQSEDYLKFRTKRRQNAVANISDAKY